MKVSFFAPSQAMVAKDHIFQQFMSWEFLNGSCDKSCDIIYCASISQLGAGLKAKAQFKKPLICWCWDIPDNWRDWKMPPQGIEENKFRDSKNAQTIERLKQCDLVISASKYTQNVLKKYNIESEQVYFYINTMELDKINVIKEDNTIVQVSRYYWNKKFEYTLQAIDNKYMFESYGINLKGVYGKWLINQYEGHLINDNIPRYSVISQIKAAKLLVSPSCFEGWGITPIEAIYLDVPILTSDIPVMKEVWGEAGYYFQNHNIEDYRDKLTRIMEDKELQKKVVRECKLKITEFTPHKFANRWKKAIKNGI